MLNRSIEYNDMGPYRSVRSVYYNEFLDKRT